MKLGTVESRRVGASSWPSASSAESIIVIEVSDTSAFAQECAGRVDSSCAGVYANLMHCFSYSADRITSCVTQSIRVPEKGILHDLKGHSGGGRAFDWDMMCHSRATLFTGDRFVRVRQAVRALLRRRHVTSWQDGPRRLLEPSATRGSLHCHAVSWILPLAP